MNVIGEGLCRNAGIKKGQLVHGDYHHKVELTERDLLLLEGLLAEYMPEGDDKHATSEHITHMFGLIQLMLTDY